MPSEPLLISLLIFAGMLFLITGSFWFIKHTGERRSMVDKIIHEGTSQVKQKTKRKNRKDLTASKAILKKYVVKLTVLVGDFMKPKKKGELSHMQITFLQAGYRNRNAMTIYYGAKGLSILLMISVFFLLRLFVPGFAQMKPLYKTLSLIFLSLAGCYLPYLWIRLKIHKRKSKMFKDFPDMLDLLVVCVEAGVGLNAAIHRVSEELKISHKEISEELNILNMELRAGKPRRDAFKNLSLRIDLEDVKSFIALLIQTERFGTSIAKALRVYSDTMRVKRYQRAEEKASKIPVKLLFPLVFFIFPSLFITILGPAILQVVKIWPF